MVKGWKPEEGSGPLDLVGGTDDLGEVDVAVEPEEGAIAPAPLSPADPVPRFRPDLRVARGTSPGLLDVTDPERGRSFTLYEFELAVARLLDGRRPASEVVESGARLGIPIDLEGLNAFVRQMWRYGFLASPGAGPEPSGPGTWAEREAWDEATRSLFQTGVRLLRGGRGEDAAGYFEAVLDAHPGNAEATEMLALIASGRPLAATPIGGRGEAPTPARPARRRVLVPVVAAVATLAVAAAFALLPASRGARTPPAAVPPAPPVPPSPPLPVEIPPPAAPPPPAWRSGLVETRRPARLADVVAPGEGSLAWRRRAGDRVRKGDRLGEVRVAARGGTASPELARRIAELERLAAQDPVYRDFLERARREQRRATRGRTRALAIVAPATGVLTLPPDAPRRAQEAGTVLGWIVDPAAWQLGLVLDGEAPPIEAECEVLGDDPAERARCRILSSEAVDGRATVTAEVDAASAPWIGRAQSPAIRVAPARAAAGADR